MKTRALVWQVLTPYTMIILCSVIAGAWYASYAVRGFHYAQTEARLKAAARIVAHEITSTGQPLETVSIDKLCGELSQTSGYRITVILPDGKVIGDSEKDPAQMDNHANRDEVRSALQDGHGKSRRYSDTLKTSMMYVAVATPTVDKPVAIVRTSLSLADVDGTVGTLRHRIIVAGFVLAALAMIAGTVISRRITRPIDRIRTGAESFAAGDLDVTLPPSAISEIHLLSQTMNNMAAQLRERIDTVTRQRDEQEALFACMTECVVAVDTRRRVLKMNAAAEALFDVKMADCLGRNIVEVIRNSELHDIVEQAIAGEEPGEKDIYLFDRDLYLQVHGTALRGPEGRKIGAVIVLNDVTRLRRLETIRRDFVANISHELKTPITSILGSVDTLREGAAENESDRNRFLDIVHRQSGRLKSIVDDLLALSRIERDGIRDDIDVRLYPVAPVMEAAVQSCRVLADSKQTRLTVNCPAELTAMFDRQLLEQALTNLVDNAIKYSPDGKTVVLDARETPAEVTLSVRDEGPGIEARHIARLFERFYRVDTGRSRRLGGTGLGLSIVKHIATVHGGRVSVDTALERGSTFTIHLPKDA